MIATKRKTRRAGGPAYCNTNYRLPEYKRGCEELRHLCVNCHGSIDDRGCTRNNHLRRIIISRRSTGPCFSRLKICVQWIKQVLHTGHRTVSTQRYTIEDRIEDGSINWINDHDLIDGLQMVKETKMANRRMFPRNSMNEKNRRTEEEESMEMWTLCLP